MTRAQEAACAKKAMRGRTAAGAATGTMGTLCAARAGAPSQAQTRITVTAKVDASVMSVDSAHAR